MSGGGGGGTTNGALSLAALSVVDEDGYILMSASERTETSKLSLIHELEIPHLRTTASLSMSTAAERNQEVLDQSKESLWECSAPASLWDDDRVIDTDDSSQESEFEAIELSKKKTKTSFL